MMKSKVMQAATYQDGTSGYLVSQVVGNVATTTSTTTGDDDEDFYRTLSSFNYEESDIVSNNFETTNLSNCTNTIHQVTTDAPEAFNFLTAIMSEDVETALNISNNPTMNPSQRMSPIITTSHSQEDNTIHASSSSNTISSPITSTNKQTTLVHNKPHSPLSPPPTAATAVSISSITGRPLYPRQRHTGNTRCFNCSIDHTPMWRKGLQGEILCNKCGLYLTRHGKERPLNLQEESGATTMVDSNVSSNSGGSGGGASTTKKRRSSGSKVSSSSVEGEGKKKRERKIPEKRLPGDLEVGMESKAKKKIKTVLATSSSNNSAAAVAQSSPFDSIISDCHLGTLTTSSTSPILNTMLAVSNQLIASPTSSYWNIVNESPVNQVLPSPTSTSNLSQTPIMLNKTESQHNGINSHIPNDWILSQLSTCPQPVMQKQVWPCYTTHQSVPNTVIYSSESPQIYSPFQSNNNNWTTTSTSNIHSSSPAYQSEDQFNCCFNNGAQQESQFVAVQQQLIQNQRAPQYSQMHHQAHQQHSPSLLNHQFNVVVNNVMNARHPTSANDSMFALRLDQHDFMSELLSNINVFNKF